MWSATLCPQCAKLKYELTHGISCDDKAVQYEVRELHPDGTIRRSLLAPPQWEIQTLDSNQNTTCYETKDFAVRYTILDHGTPSVAYLFAEKSHIKIGEFPYTPGKWIADLKAAYQQGKQDIAIDVHGEIKRSVELFPYLYEQPGYRVGFVMDHLPSAENHDKICALCHEADELYIEAYYRDVDRNYALENHHSTAQSFG